MVLGLDIGGTSIKAALLDGARIVSTGRSGGYRRPDRPTLERALKECLSPTGFGAATSVTRVGICAPGMFDEPTGIITASINVPGIVGVNLQDLCTTALGRTFGPLACFTDAHAAAFDLYTIESPRPAGRLLAISIGTGVGASVLDDGVPLLVSGRSPGHFGQIDVSIDEPGREPPLGPDGGRGGLEAYIGLPALLSRFRCEPDAVTSHLNHDDAPLRALARAIRIAHAIYRPHHIRLLGGIGIRLAPHVDWLKSEALRALTSMARPAWTLSCGSSDFHAACGVARLAASNL